MDKSSKPFKPGSPVTAKETVGPISKGETYTVARYWVTETGKWLEVVEARQLSFKASRFTPNE